MRGRPYFHKISDLPRQFAVFPLSRVLLLPGSNLPLNIFEPRYLAMVDDALKTDRAFAMIQPHEKQPGGVPIGPNGLDRPALYDVGCLGRLVSFQETGDGRYHILLKGVARFRIRQELPVTTLYRQVIADFSEFEGDLSPAQTQEIDRPALLQDFRRYLDHRQLSTDWKAVENTSTEDIVNSLAMNCPFEASEKQALLEAPDLKARAAILTALIRMASAGPGEPPDTTLQ